MAITTIQISEQIKKVLERNKISNRDSYSDVLFYILEDAGLLELNEETKKEIIKAEEEIKKGEFVSHKDLKKELGIE